MQLERPLLFFDLEATGLDTEKDRIIEFACVRVGPDEPRSAFQCFVNPERSIPKVITELTGITEHDVATAATFRELAPTLERLLHNADLAGYNAASFDVPLLRSEFKRIGKPLPGPYDRVVLDSLEILRKNEIRNLTWAHSFYFGTTIPDAHRALADVEATENILFEQARRYDLSGSAREISADLRHPYLDSRRKLKREGDEVVLCFGKHSGKSISALLKEEPTYIDWMIETLDPEIGDFIRVELQDKPKGTPEAAKRSPASTQDLFRQPATTKPVNVRPAAQHPADELFPKPPLSRTGNQSEGDADFDPFDPNRIE